MNDTAEVFREAARVMAERGHCKGALNDSSGRVCLYGALHVAQGVTTTMRYFTLTDAADRLVAEFDPTAGHRCAPVWNDVPERTQTEVEKFLLWAADRIDADEAGA